MVEKGFCQFSVAGGSGVAVLGEKITPVALIHQKRQRVKERNRLDGKKVFEALLRLKVLGQLAGLAQRKSLAGGGNDVDQ